MFDDVVRVGGVSVSEAWDVPGAADVPEAGDPDDVPEGRFASVRAPDGEELAAGAPGPGLVWRLVEADPAATDEYALVELVAAWTRVVSWAQGNAALVAAHLAARQAVVAPEPSTERRGRRAPAVSVSAHEIAMRLAISRPAAQTMIELGRALQGALAPVGEALLGREIDLPRARAFHDGLSGVALPVALDVQDAVLPGAPTRTAAQVARDITAALMAVDPVEATARHARARACRRVCHPRVLPDGMAGVYAVLPAADAVALDVALDAVARAARAGGDARTTDQLRADALAATAHHALATGALTAIPWTLTTAGEEDLAGRDGTGQVGPAESPGPAGVPAASSPPASSSGRSPDRVAGPACPSPSQHRRLAAGAPPEDPLPEDGPSELGAGPAGEHLTVVPPGGLRLGRIGGRHAHIDVTVPLAVLMGLDDLPPGTLGAATGPEQSLPEPASADASASAGDQTSTADATATDPEAPSASAADATGPGAVAGGQEPASATGRPPTASGSGRLPPVAVLGRYGPVTPDVARALALGGTWRRLVTDPASGVVRDVGRTRYHPPGDLAELVRARDATCVRPGCSVRASACDLDHTTPFHQRGATAEANLGTLCAVDHAMKTRGDYRVTQPRAGTFDFHLPSGHTYRRHPDGTVTLLNRRGPGG